MTIQLVCFSVYPQKLNEGNMPQIKLSELAKKLMNLKL
ncbi:hypothetical protein LEP1GSC151_4247 [Leptospira interrogans serovar Grippotyphosa str. LT2186]|uniref:Uncharacterized protein n=1 Tax=Leptospira interrogans serovar Grippotyphosa str. LT2186 TaxID=1001599 RepID=M3IA42_LEPIR|nr:hypothetical protein LEP1GSC151_4247 [Leptospira interrogans serovar Grippotyphosa str. LT2186]